MSKSVAAVLVAAGASQRFNESFESKEKFSREGALQNKALFPLEGKPNFIWAAECLFQGGVDQICVVTSEENFSIFKSEIEKSKLLNLEHFRFAVGGKRRQDSVRMGLKALSDFQPESVFVHDAARPIFRPSYFKALRLALRQFKAVIPVLPIVETVVQVQAASVDKVLNRENLKRVQTPQAFSYSKLWELHLRYSEGEEVFTDDASLFLKEGIPVGSVEGDPFNFKITRFEDQKLLEALLKCGINFV
jgi:2-C-methyl-D-erythritol 4-phosphate cytidylyltransferase